MAHTFRHPAEQDLDLITSIINMSRRETVFHRDLTPAEVNTDTFEDSDYRPEGAWLVFDGTRPVAYGIGVIEKGRIDAGLDDGWVEMDVIPQERRRGAEEGLMRLALAYLGSCGVSRAVAKIEETQEWKKSLYLNFGFKSVRHFYRLALRATADIPPREMPPGIEVTHQMMKDMPDDEVAAFAEVFNDTFSEHFDFAPDPAWKWIKWRDACDDPWMISLARMSSDIAAFCVTEDSRNYNAERGIRSGWINYIGVRKALRGQGLGAAMLVDGMRWLRGLGHDTIFIGVDAENEKALGLYKSLGFEVENESRTYHLDFKKHSVSPTNPVDTDSGSPDRMNI